MQDMPEISVATWSDKDRAAATMTLAFGDDALMRWGFPDPHQFISTFLPYVSMYGGAAYDHGSAYVIG